MRPRRDGGSCSVTTTGRCGATYTGYKVNADTVDAIGPLSLSAGKGLSCASVITEMMR